MEQSSSVGVFDRLKHDTAAAILDAPAVLGSWIRRLQHEGEGLGLNLTVRGLDSFEKHLDRSANRLSLALVALGLYIGGSLLMQHSIGPVSSITCWLSPSSPTHWRSGSPCGWCELLAGREDFNAPGVMGAGLWRP